MFVGVKNVLSDAEAIGRAKREQADKVTMLLESIDESLKKIAQCVTDSSHPTIRTRVES